MASAHKLGIAPEKVVLTVDKHGNTSAASIPLALCVAVRDGRIKKGDLVLMEAMGGGFTWGVGAAPLVRHVRHTCKFCTVLSCVCMMSLLTIVR